MMKKHLTTLAAVLGVAMTMTVFTACTDNEDNPVNPTPSVDSQIVGNWCSDVSGKTYAKWNYGKTWQHTEFKADGTGSTRIYYTFEDNAIGIEKIDFTYTATADGTLTMTPSDREAMTAKWQMAGDELHLAGDGDSSLSFTKTSSDMAAKFDRWSQQEEVFEVPQPAKYTVFVYGNAGGTMDRLIEQGFWERAQQLLTDTNNVRVVCMYKYGMDRPEEGKYFTGQYAAPGDIVWFELTDQTDLDKIKEDGMQAIGMGEEAKKLKICNPNTMRMFLEFSSLACPAKDYVLLIWGHGSGFYALQDVPGKYEITQPVVTRGVMIDEWVNNEWMDMYAMGDALKAAGFDKLSTLMFHNCFMGNIESLTEIKGFADYIIASSHVLSSDGLLATEFVRGLIEKGNPIDAAGQMFENASPDWQNSYADDFTGTYLNGDYKMIRTDKIDAIVTASQQLCDRLLTLYSDPAKKEAVNKATSQVYRVYQINVLDGTKMYFYYPFFDLADYAHQLVKETDDAEMKTIADALDKAFKDAFVHYRDINNSQEHLEHYTLTVNLIDKDNYVFDYKSAYPMLNAVCNFKEGYEQCKFHQITNWGKWLDTNEQLLDSNPQNGR